MGQGLYRITHDPYRLRNGDLFRAFASKEEIVEELGETFGEFALGLCENDYYGIYEKVWRDLFKKIADGSWSTMSKIIIFGIGRGANVATRYFADDSPHEIVAYTADDEYVEIGTDFLGRPVIPFSRINEEIPPADAEMFVPLGFQRMNALRAEKFAAAKEKGYTLASYLSSRILTSGKPTFGENCFILEGNVFNYDVKIGDNVVMWSSNHVGDLSTIEDHVFISSHVVLSGEVRIGASSFLGVNSTISNYVRVGERSYVGANTLVAQDVPPDSVLVTKGSTVLDGIDSLRFLDLIKS